MSEKLSAKVVFVLDVSGSMNGMKLETLNLAVKRYIEDIPDGHYVGIVLFESKVWIQHKVVKITDRSVRDSLIAKCPQRVFGDNDFEGGLSMALTALGNEGLSTEGATLIFVTDGQDTWSVPHYGRGVNYVDIALPKLLSAKVRVVCIAIGHQTDPNLERLSRETNGITYIASDSNREMAVRVIESAIQEVKTSKEISEALTISVCNDLIAINKQLIAYEVIIDSDIGRNTTFTVGSEDIDCISISITSPNGTKYDLTSSELSKSQSLKRFQLKLKSVESGVWTLSLTKHTNQRVCASVSVLSQPLNPNAIQMKVWLKDADINRGFPPIIFTEIRKGSNAIIGAEVMATIDKPNGTQTDVKLINLNDFYYSYFTEYCGSGRYNVSVLSKNMGNLCRLKTNNGSVPSFQRQLIAGCFKVESFTPSAPTNQSLNDLTITEVYKSLSKNSCSSNITIETPKPRTAIAIIKPSSYGKVPQLSEDIKIAKENLWDLFLEVKKSVNSAKISDIEKKTLKNTIEEINAFIKSKNSSTLKEVENNKNKLENIKRKL